MMGKEIELKLEVPPQELRRLKGWRTLSRKGAGEQDLASVYFDTPKHKLGRNGISLRIRRNGKKRLQTVKSQGADGSFRRGEWENEIKGDVPDLRKVQGTALEPLLTKKLKHRLLPVFETRVRRTVGPVRRNGSRIEVALDEGEIRAGRRSAPISEVELELKGGDVDEVFELARELGKHVSVKLALNSKSQRGYDLLDDKQIEAARAEKIELRHGMSPVEAFLVIGRSILRHIAANESAVRKLDSEGVHQMRVGLRRLRGAMALFKRLLGDKQSERIKSELKWLTGELAPARDLDVYERSKIEPLRGVLPGKTGMKELADTLSTRRAVVRGVIVRFSSTRCNGLKTATGPSIGAVKAVRSKGLPRRFLRAEPRRQGKKRGSCASSIQDSVINCGLRSKNCAMAAISSKICSSPTKRESACHASRAA
jgi:triphosphatase